MEKKEYAIELSERAAKHGLELGKKVYMDKLNFPDKFHLGGAHELQADIYGFMAESCVCEHFKHPLPAFKKQENDEYDLIINDRKVDVKKVGFSKYSKKPLITLNKRQYNRKKNKIDVFLFGIFKGAFNSEEVGGFQLTIPLPKISRFVLLGWIPSSEILKKAQNYEWKNRAGEVIDVSYKLRVSQLYPVEELIK